MMDHGHSSEQQESTQILDMTHVLQRLTAVEQENRDLREENQQLRLEQRANEERFETLEESTHRALYMITKLEKEHDQTQNSTDRVAQYTGFFESNNLGPQSLQKQIADLNHVISEPVEMKHEATRLMSEHRKSMREACNEMNEEFKKTKCTVQTQFTQLNESLVKRSREIEENQKSVPSRHLHPRLQAKLQHLGVFRPAVSTMRSLESRLPRYEVLLSKCQKTTSDCMSQIAAIDVRAIFKMQDLAIQIKQVDEEHKRENVVTRVCVEDMSRDIGSLKNQMQPMQDETDELFNRIENIDEEFSNTGQDLGSFKEWAVRRLNYLKEDIKLTREGTTEKEEELEDRIIHLERTRERRDILPPQQRYRSSPGGQRAPPNRRYPPPMPPPDYPYAPRRGPQYHY